MLDKNSIIKGAEKAQQMRSGTYCFVASGKGPTDRELNHVAEAVEEIKSKYDLKICACLGILKPGQAERLKNAGVSRYNHNIILQKIIIMRLRQVIRIRIGFGP